MKLIDKDVLLKMIDDEINILVKNSGYTGMAGDIQMGVYERLLNLINTLEVKEIGLDKRADV